MTRSRPGGAAAWRRLVAALGIALGIALATPALPAEGGATQDLLERALAAESASLEVLLDHHRLEADLLSPDFDRLAVFLSADADRLAEVEQVQLLVDGSRHSPELGQLPPGRVLTVPLLLQRIGPGAHTLRLDLRLAGGRGLVSESVRIDKGGRARFVEFSLDGGRVIRLRVRHW